jgi:hypothetical protein
MTGIQDTIRSRYRPLDELPAVFTGAYGLGLVIACALIILPTFPPLQDYWEWTYQAVLIEQLLVNPVDGAPVEFRDYPVPNALVQGVGAVLNFVFPATWTAKAIMLGYLALTVLVFRSLQKLAPNETAAPAMMVLFSIMLGSQFFNGYANNIFGNLILTLWFITILRRRPLIIETLIVSFVLFFCHATSYVVFGMIVVIHVFWRAFRWQHLIALVPTGIMFLWYSAVKERYVEDGLVLSGLSDWFLYKVYTVAKLGPYHNVFLGEIGDVMRSPVLFYAGVAINLLFALFVLVLILQVFIRNRFVWISDPAFVSVAVLIAAYPFMPVTVSGVVNIGERFLTIAVLLMIPLAALGPLRWTLNQGAALCLFLLPVLGLFTLNAVRFEAGGVTVPAFERVDALPLTERLFWHRAYQGWRRLEDVRAVRDGGLLAAAPLEFTTSLITDTRREGGIQPANSGTEGAAR